MKLYSESAEIRLLEHIREIKKVDTSISWHCVFCTLGKQHSSTKESKDTFITLLRSSDLEHRDISLYWLASGHIFIFSKDQALPVAKTMTDILKMAAEEEGTLLMKPVIIDLSKEWDLFEELVKNPSNAGALQDLKTSRQPITATAELPPPKSPGTIDLRGSRRRRYKPTLLSVEDDRLSQQLISAMMEPYCDIVVAKNAQEAREVYDEKLPNIVFMDIELPDGNGEELTKNFCYNDPEAFIVMVSGHLSLENVDRCMQLGARGFVAKPVNKQLNRMLYFINLYNSENRLAGANKKKGTP